MVKREWQGHWASIDATTSELALVDGQAEYEIPSRAVASSIQKAVLAGPNGARVPLSYLEMEKREVMADATGIPRCYTIRGNRLYLYPTPRNATGHSLRVPMLIRPAQLVLAEECGRIVGSSAPAGGLVTLSVVPSPSEEIQNASVFDVVRGTEPYETCLLEVEGEFTAPSACRVSEAAAAGLREGDYLCLPGTSPFPQCPVELLNILAARVAAEQLSSIGDGEIAAAKAATLPEQRNDMTSLVKPRTGERRLRGNGMDKWRGGGSWG
jgi:hypothetical protein